MAQTGNFYVEFEQKLRTGLWAPSGIAVPNGSELWMFAAPNQGAALFVRREVLAEICRTHMHRQGKQNNPSPCAADATQTFQHEWRAVGCTPYESENTRPTHGVLLPVDLLMEVAWRAEGQAA